MRAKEKGMEEANEQRSERATAKKKKRESAITNRPSEQFCCGVAMKQRRIEGFSFSYFYILCVFEDAWNSCKQWAMKETLIQTIIEISFA